MAYTYDQICNKYFFRDGRIFDEISDSIYYNDKAICNLIFGEAEVLDEKYEAVQLPAIKRFDTLTEWRMFMNNVIARFDLVEKYAMLFVKRAKEIEEGGDDEESAQSYWNDSDDDSYPKSDFESFKDWYGSSAYYDWVNDNRSISWNDFQKENEAMSKISSDHYADNYGIHMHSMQRHLDSIRKDLNTILKECDNEIANSINENKYDAIVDIFED